MKWQLCQQVATDRLRPNTADHRGIAPIKSSTGHLDGFRLDHRHGAADWLVSAEEQAAIASYRVGGEQAFVPLAMR